MRRFENCFFEELEFFLLNLTCKFIQLSTSSCTVSRAALMPLETKLDRMLSILECRSSPPTRETPNPNPKPLSLQHRPPASVFPSQPLSRGWSTSNLERQVIDLPPTLLINRFLPLFTVDSLILLLPLLDHDTVRLLPLSDRRYLPNR